MSHEANEQIAKELVITALNRISLPTDNSKAANVIGEYYATVLKAVVDANKNARTT